VSAFRRTVQRQKAQSFTDRDPNGASELVSALDESIAKAKNALGMEAVQEER
jgi:hypothetical protein